MNDAAAAPLSPRDWHVLVALSREPLHGYAVTKAVEEDSNGKVTAEIGSLYRILNRLLEEGLVTETHAPDDAPDETRGRPRRYYALTDAGRSALRAESQRLREALDLARARQLLPDPPR